jgi:NAD(P)-dependent dehydrogenase (short-subunit alcohol dehydrogenase family)
MTTSRDFNGKIVLVTGSSSGIGEEIATQFAKYGAKVVITGRDEGRIAGVVEKCNQVSPSKFKALGVTCDFTKDVDIRKMVDQVISIYGGVDILVNNAGAFSYTPIKAPNVMETYDTIFQTNVRAKFYLVHLLVPHLIKSKGNIVNISAVYGLHPTDIAPAYCASNAAVDMFTKCLAIDLGPKGVRVNSVNPAATRTPIFGKLGVNDEMFKHLENKCKEDYPLGRIGEMNDVAKLVRFLASDDASFITGLVAPVDGGAVLTITGISPVSA